MASFAKTLEVEFSNLRSNAFFSLPFFALPATDHPANQWLFALPIWPEMIDELLVGGARSVIANRAHI